MKKNSYVLFMMGGSGTRFGNKLPKQFTLVQKTPIFIYPIKKYELIKSVKGIVIVCNPLYLEVAKKYCKKYSCSKIIDVVPGGCSRSESVLNGVNALLSIANDNDVILIHDATHPFVDVKNTKRLINLIDSNGGGTLVNYVFDTAYIKSDDNYLESIIDRKRIAIGASPEGFTFLNMKKMYISSTKEELESMTSSGALALKNNIKMPVVEIDYLNLKITYKRDMRLFEELCNYYNK